MGFDQRKLRKHGVKREKAQRSNSTVTNLVSVGWENLFGRFFAASREKLREVAARLNVRRVGKLAGRPAP